MKHSLKTGIAVVYAGTVLFSTASYAQQKDKPGVFPTIAISYASDDNVFRQATSKIEDDIITFAPELLLVKAFGKHRMILDYKGEFASYSENTTEDYNDHFVNFDFLFDLSRKFNINLKADYNRVHETRESSGITNTILNEWTESHLFTGFAYGRRTAKAQLELDFAFNNLAFTNNNQDFRDHEDNTVSARVFYNFSKKSSVFVEAKQKTLDYVNPAARNLDSTENFYHLGFRWDVTGKTTGELKLGTFEKDFDSAVETDGDGSSYVASILWKPKSYSHVTFEFSRSPQEIASVDSFYISSLFSLDWEHSFSSKVALNLNLSSGIDEYSGTREDSLSDASLGLNYKFSRMVEMGLKYTSSERDSNFNAADYSYSIIMLTATVSKL